MKSTYGRMVEWKFFFSVLLSWFLTTHSQWQNTQVHAFIDQVTAVKDEKLSFTLVEPDLFITSDMYNRVSFLGETVFRFDKESPTYFKRR
ncbi:MAG: hypothetical protein ABIQ74_13695 [Chitinophagales bacterium]